MQFLVFSLLISYTLLEVTPATVKDLKKIFQTPVKRDCERLQILDRAGFSADSDVVDELVDNPKSYANAQVLLRFGGDKSCGCSSSCRCPPVPLVYSPFPLTLPYFAPSPCTTSGDLRLSSNSGGSALIGGSEEIDDDNLNTAQINIVNNDNSNSLGWQVNNQNTDISNQQIDSSSTSNNLWQEPNIVDLFQPERPDNPITKALEKITVQLVKDIAEELVRNQYQLSKNDKSTNIIKQPREQFDIVDLFPTDSIDNPIVQTVDKFGPKFIGDIVSEVSRNQRKQARKNKKKNNIIKDNNNVNNFNGGDDYVIIENNDAPNKIGIIQGNPNLVDLFQPDNSRNPIIKTFEKLTTKFIEDINKKISKSQNLNVEDNHPDNLNILVNNQNNLFDPKNSQNPIVQTFEKVGENFLKDITEKLLENQSYNSNNPEYQIQKQFNLGDNLGALTDKTDKDMMEQNRFQNRYIPVVDSRPGEGKKLLVSYPFYPNTPGYNNIQVLPDSSIKPVSNVEINGQNVLAQENIVQIIEPTQEQRGVQFGQQNDRVEYVCFPVDDEGSVRRPFLTDIVKKLQQSFLEPNVRFPVPNSYGVNCNCRYVGELNQKVLL